MFVYREAYYLKEQEPRPATVEHAEWQAKMNEVSNLQKYYWKTKARSNWKYYVGV